METQTPIVVTVEATVNAPVEKVWNAYTEPDHITKWNFAHESWQCPWAKNDLKVGGRYIARMEAKDGSFGFEFAATYSEVENHKKLSYALDDGRKCTVNFTPEGNSTKVTVTFEAESMNPVEMQKGGWQAILDNFRKYSEAN